MADELAQSFSGAPSPPPPLSGLLFGTMGLSNTGQGSEGGTLAGGRGGPGMQAGPGLDILSLLQQLTGGGGGGDMSAGVSPLALGQQAGGLGAGSFGQAGVQSPFFQTIGQQGMAGQAGQAPQGQVSAGTGSADPLAIIQKLLGLGQKATGLFDTLQSGGPGGTDLQTGTGTVGGYSLYGQPGSSATGSPLQGDLTGSLTGTSFLQDPAFKLFEQGLLTGNPDTLGTFQGLPQSVQQQYLSALLGGGGGGETPALSPSGYSLGVSPLSMGGGTSGGGIGVGDIGAGLGGIGGLLSIIQGARSGNPLQAGQGALSTYQALSSLFPEVFPSISQGISAGAQGLGMGASAAAGAAGAATEALPILSIISSFLQAGLAPSPEGAPPISQLASLLTSPAIFTAVPTSLLESFAASQAPAGTSRQVSRLRNRESQSRDAAFQQLGGLNQFLGANKDLSGLSNDQLSRLANTAYNNVFNEFMVGGAPGVTSARVGGHEGIGGQRRINAVGDPLSPSPQTADTLLQAAMGYGNITDILNQRGQPDLRGANQFQYTGGGLRNAVGDAGYRVVGGGPGNESYRNYADPQWEALSYFMRPDQSATEAMLRYGLDLVPGGYAGLQAGGQADPVQQQAMTLMQALESGTRGRIQSNQPLTNAPWARGPLLRTGTPEWTAAMQPALDAQALAEQQWQQVAPF